MDRREQSIESDYYRHQSFDADHIRRVRSFYLQFIEEREYVVELGCGRGEFLQLVAEQGKRTLGVDLDPGMIAAAGRRGLQTVHQDAIEFLETTGERPDVVFSAHLVEHMTVEGARRMFTASSRCLVPGGVMVAVTPNPACLAVILSDFWNDPTHVRPYTIPLLEFIAKQAGLEPVVSGFNTNDVPGAPPELRVSQSVPEWGALEPPGLPPWPQDQLDGTDAATKLATLALLQRIYDVNHALFEQIALLNDRIEQTRRQAVAAGDAVNRTLGHLYGPNEIFLVARSPS